MAKKIQKQIKKLPENIRLKLTYLIDDLTNNGPVQQDWPNYCKLGDNLYHCHLAYGWVVCWYNEKDSLIIEVYYAGSRENAPY